MTAADHVKIGIAKDPCWRRTMLQSACPFEVTLEMAVAFPSLGMARSIELELHRAFGDSRTYGEWFHIPLKWGVQALTQKFDKAVWWNNAFPRSRRRKTEAERLEELAEQSE